MGLLVSIIKLFPIILEFISLSYIYLHYLNQLQIQLQLAPRALMCAATIAAPPIKYLFASSFTTTIELQHSFQLAHKQNIDQNSVPNYNDIDIILLFIVFNIFSLLMPCFLHASKSFRLFC